MVMQKLSNNLIIKYEAFWTKLLPGYLNLNTNGGGKKTVCVHNKEDVFTGKREVN